MFKILVVEDSQIVRKILNKLVEDNPHFQSVLCADYAQAKAKIESDEEYLAAIVDLNLPDAPRGEIVELMLSHNVPTAVLTGNFDETLRNVLIDKGVLDYITKESRYSYMQVIKLIDRLRKNLTTKVLVVDDSTTSNSYLSAFLRKFRFQVMSAFDGVEALKILRENPDIKLVISDYMMPNMDGFELVKAVRQDRAFQDLVFIGLSANGNSMLSAKFIKSGANDFLSKPFYHEEFFCRVLQNLEAQEMLETIGHLSRHVRAARVFKKYPIPSAFLRKRWELLTNKIDIELHVCCLFYNNQRINVDIVNKKNCFAGQSLDAESGRYKDRKATPLDHKQPVAVQKIQALHQPKHNHVAWFHRHQSLAPKHL